ncbi:MAG TPA: hypothetical protein VGX45_14115, partial [Solirubrobacteraceae bacterium]|nr:hypothetical protein [Solirubrobacteraceae bacterium]
VAICADVSRRIAGLGARTGGFTLVAAEAVRRSPALVAEFDQIVVLDPPASQSLADALMHGRGFMQLAWGEPELRFAEQVHELEYRLRDSLVALYREFKRRQHAIGAELERLLRGDGPHGRSPRLAGRLVRVLVELGLVELDRDAHAARLSLLGARRRADLHQSEAYRYYDRIYEDGRRFLSNATSRAAA